ncbi:MAG: carboxylesterase family protein, partial [Acetobacteraceae bacterium]
ARRLSTTVKGLRALPAQTVHDAELALSREPGMVRRLGRAPVLPVLDGQVLTAWPRDGALPPVPLLIGTTRDEGNFWYDLVLPDGTPVLGPEPPSTHADLLTAIGDLVAIYRPEADKIPPESIARVYRQAALAAGADAGSKALASSLYTDTVFRLRAVEVGKRHAATGNPTFLYEYAHDLAPPGRGAPHTAEIPFIFGTYAHPFFAGKLGAGGEQAALSVLMLRAWARFAHDGDPGGWVRLAPDGSGISVLGAPGALCRTVPSARPDQLAIWGV